MPKFLSGRQKNLKLGVKGYTENEQVLNILGQVGIGTTYSQQHTIGIGGSVRVDGSVSIGGTLYSDYTGVGSISADRIDVGSIGIGGTLGDEGQYVRSTGAGVTWASFPTLRTGFSTVGVSSQTQIITSYNIDFLDIFVNGVLLNSSEYQASDGFTILFNDALDGGEIIDIFSYNTTSNYVGGSGGGGGTINIGGDSLWTEAVVGIYTNTNVGINSEYPESALSVTGDVKVIGVVTATNFVGDGSGLTNITATGTGVEIRDSGAVVGTAATIDFGNNINVSPISAGVVTVSSSGGGGISGAAGTTGNIQYNDGGSLGADNSFTYDTSQFKLSVNNFQTNVITTTDPTLSINTNTLVSGILTATQFIGDGSGLTNITATGSGVQVKDNGVTVGTAATIDFGSNLSVSLGSGIATVTGQVSAYADNAGIATIATYTAEWTLGANSIQDYTFSGPGFTGAENDPTLYLIRGQKYKFTNTMGAHPFRIQSTPNGSTGTQYNDGITNNDISNGTLFWDVQFDSPNKLYYQCTSHTNMGGVIHILDEGGTGGVTYWSSDSNGIHTTANVGISTNTADSSYVLDVHGLSRVVGNFVVDDELSVNNNLFVTNVATASTLTLTKDATVGENLTVTKDLTVSRNGNFSGVVTASQFTTQTGGTPTITSPNNLNLNANTVAISTDVTIGRDAVVSNNLNVSGISTFSNVTVGGATTELIVEGDARITGILTVGSSSVTINGDENKLLIGTGLVIDNVGGATYSGIVTATTFEGNLSGTATTATNLADASNITTGTISIDRLGTSGTKDSTTFLRGDNTFAVVDSTSLKDAGGNIKVQANPNGATVTGVVTATSFSGDGSGLIGVASTDNIVTDTVARFNNTTRIAGLELAGITTGLNVSGVATFASNLDISGEIRGPAEFIIDPAAVGDNTGAVRIKGDLYVDGENFIVDSETIRLADHVVGIASTSNNDLLTDGAGIGIGTDKFFTFDNTNTAFKSTENLNLESGHTYKINGTDVLSNDTLGSGVVNSALTSVGNLNKLEVGSISLNSGIVTATTFEGSGANLTNLTGASANTYGSDASVPILTVDDNGRITGIGTTVINDKVTRRTTTSYTATEGQTTFNVEYDINYIDVYLNGNKLDSSEFVANNGSTVVLNTGAVVDDILEFVAYTSIGAVNASNTIRRTTKFTATSGQTTFAVTYDVGYVDVFQNGVKLDESEFTATDGVSVVLTTGAITSDILEFVTYTGVGLISSSLTTRATTSYTATSGQTTFAVNYVVGYVDVFQNGVKLDSTEFTATNGTSVVLTTGAVVDDIIEFIAYASIGVTSITVNDDTSPSLGGNLDLNSNDITGTGNISIVGIITSTTLSATDLNVTGNVSIAGTLTYDDVTNVDSIGLITARSGINVTGGNVGIGLTNPSHMLHLKSAGDARIHIQADSDNSGENDNPRISFSQDGSSDTWLFQIGLEGYGDATMNGSLSNAPIISADNGNLNAPIQIGHLQQTIMTIKNGSYTDPDPLVGIGTNNPQVPLHISGTNGILVDDSTNGKRLDLRSKNDVVELNAYDPTNSNAAVPIVFKHYTSERFRIDSNGDTTLGRYAAPSTNSAISSQTLNFIGSGWNTGTGGNEVGTKLQSQHAYWTGNYSGAYGQTYPDFKILIKNSDSSTYDEKFAFSGNGVMRLQSGGGINFHNYGSGTGVSSNILDDYEEGTWTPTIGGTTTGSFTAGGANVGRYTKVGRMVTASATIHWTSASYSGLAYIGGLPYAGNSATNFRVAGSMPGQNSGFYATGTYTDIKAGLDWGLSYVYVVMVDETITSGGNYSHSPGLNSAGYIYGFTITYQAD